MVGLGDEVPPQSILSGGPGIGKPLVGGLGSEAAQLCGRSGKQSPPAILNEGPGGGSLLMEGLGSEASHLCGEVWGAKPSSYIERGSREWHPPGWGLGGPILLRVIRHIIGVTLVVGKAQ